MRITSNGRDHSSEIQLQFGSHMPDNQHQGRKKEKRLQPIRPDNRFDPTAMTIKPYNKDDDGRRHKKRHIPCIEHQKLQDGNGQIKSCGSHTDLGYQEKPCTGLIRLSAVTLSQITINTDQIQPIIQRQQHIRYDEITEKEAQHHLHIGHIQAPNHPGNRYEGHSRNRGADHGNGYDIPFRRAVGAEKSIVVRPFPAGKIRYQHQYRKIKDYNKQNKACVHGTIRVIES